MSVAFFLCKSAHTVVPLPCVSLIGHVHTVRTRKGKACVAGDVESGTAGSTADQMDMKGEFCHFLQISKTERYCS